MKIENLATELDQRAECYVLNVSELLHDITIKDVKLSPGLLYCSRKSDYVDTAHDIRYLHRFSHRDRTTIGTNPVSTTAICDGVVRGRLLIPQHKGITLTEITPCKAIIAPYMIEKLSKLPHAKGVYGNALKKGYTDKDGNFKEISQVTVHRYTPIEITLRNPRFQSKMLNWS